MLSLRSLLLTLSLLLARIASLVILEPMTPEDANREALADAEAFRLLLDQADRSALHEALHYLNPGKFRHGVFQEDRTAAEAVHRYDASLATSIVVLAKRQDNPKNNISSIAPVLTLTESSTTLTTSLELPPTVVPNPVQPTTGSTPHPVPVPVVSASSTPAASATHAPPAAPAAPLTSGQVITTIDAAGLTIVSTVDGGAVTIGSGSNPSGPTPTVRDTGSITPAGGVVQTSVVVMTDSLADGAQTTITAVTVIQGGGAAAASAFGGEGATGTARAPGLQSGVAQRSKGYGWDVVGVMGGAVGVALML